MRCKKSDCFSCPFPDCINDYVPPRRKASAETIRRACERHSRVRKERVEKGLCTQCGKRPPVSGKRMCRQCQVKAARYKRDEALRKGITPRILLDGIYLCQKCGKEAPQKPFKLCSRCLQSNRNHLALTPTHRGKRQKGGFTEAHEAFWH